MTGQLRSWRNVVRRVADAFRPTKSASAHGAAAVDYPGDFRGRFPLTYAPHPDDVADPGEVVWTWVPYEENHHKGKDRPVVIVGRHGEWLLAAPMTSKDHHGDAAQEAAAGRYWVDIGSGAWDQSGRPSQVRLNRIIRVRPDNVRRIACRLDESKFAQVAEGITQHFADRN